MKFFLAALALPAAIATTALAENKPEGRHLAELTFKSIPGSERGYVDLGNMMEMRENIFVSQDADDNERITEEEMLAWGYGFENVANESGKAHSYETAIRIVYSVWDRNHDGEITPAEHRQAMLRDFQVADVDSDGLLTDEEFFKGFFVMNAIRIALKPKD